MEAYTSFAEVYDTFMDNVPYEEWADYLEDRLKEYGVKDGLVLELGCGTGSMTELLAENREREFQFAGYACRNPCRTVFCK